MAKIAAVVEQALARRALNGGQGRVQEQVLAEGDGWSVADVICDSGPRDRAFEERHAYAAIAIVAAGSFQYRAAHVHASAQTGPELMTPGSLLLGNAGQCFECGHEHGAGDRCLGFRYAPEFFERLAADAGLRGRRGPEFRLLRVPPVRALSPVIARAITGLATTDQRRGDVPWDEISVQLAAQTLQLVDGDRAAALAPSPRDIARVTRIVRTIERHPDAARPLGSLAREAGLSPYHFLRTFERVTGTTPHQYLLRARLREAALRLATERARVLDIALESGFGDLSNFNRAFRGEFGVSPRVYRLKTGNGVS